MFHAEAEGATGREWTGLARRSGDRITTYDNSDNLDLGRSCPDADGKGSSERTCSIVVDVDEGWRP
jgi:hypothetical protein